MTPKITPANQNGPGNTPKQRKRPNTQQRAVPCSHKHNINCTSRWVRCCACVDHRPQRSPHTHPGDVEAVTVLAGRGRWSRYCQNCYDFWHTQAIPAGTLQQIQQNNIGAAESGPEGSIINAPTLPRSRYPLPIGQQDVIPPSPATQGPTEIPEPGAGAGSVAYGQRHRTNSTGPPLTTSLLRSYMRLHERAPRVSPNAPPSGQAGVSSRSGNGSGIRNQPITERPAFPLHDRMHNMALDRQIIGGASRPNPRQPLNDANPGSQSPNQPDEVPARTLNQPGASQISNLSAQSPVYVTGNLSAALHSTNQPPAQSEVLNLAQVAEDASIVLELFSKTTPHDDTEHRAMINTALAGITSIHRYLRTNSAQGGQHELLGEDEDLNVESGCVVCYARIADTALLPCRHLVLCQICCSQMGIKGIGEISLGAKCPICRELVEDKIRIFRA